MTIKKRGYTFLREFSSQDVGLVSYYSELERRNEVIMEPIKNKYMYRIFVRKGKN